MLKLLRDKTHVSILIFFIFMWNKHTHVVQKNIDMCVLFNFSTRTIFKTLSKQSQMIIILFSKSTITTAED